MGGFAEILAGIGQAAQEDRLRMQDEENKKIDWLSKTTLELANDPFNTPEQRAELLQLSYEARTGKKKSKQLEPLVINTLRRLQEAPQMQSQAVPPPPGPAPTGEVMGSYGGTPTPKVQPIPAPPGATASPFPRGSRAEAEYLAKIAMERAQGTARAEAEGGVRSRLAAEEDARKEAFLRKVAAETGQTGAALANLMTGHAVPIPAPPGQQRPFVIGDRFLVSPEGTLLYTAPEKEKLDANLVFERHEDQIKGDVTIIGRDPKTGDEKFRKVETGVSRNRPPTTHVSVYAGQEVEPWVNALSKGEVTMSQVPMAVRDKVLKQAQAKGIQILSDVERDKLAQMSKIEPILDSIAELSEKINTQRGVIAKISGMAERAKAQVNLSDDVAEYEALVAVATPLVARSIGHVGVLTEQDEMRTRSMFPKPEESKAVRDRKIARFKKIRSGVQAATEKAITEPIGPPGSQKKDPLKIR